MGRRVIVEFGPLVVLAKLQGRVGADGVDELRKMFDRMRAVAVAAGTSGRLDVECSRLEWITSEALRVVSEGVEALRARRVDVRVVAAPAKVQEAFLVVGLGGVLAEVPGEELRDVG